MPDDDLNRNNPKDTDNQQFTRETNREELERGIDLTKNNNHPENEAQPVRVHTEINVPETKETGETIKKNPTAISGLKKVSPPEDKTEPEQTQDNFKEEPSQEKDENDHLTDENQPEKRGERREGPEEEQEGQDENQPEKHEEKRGEPKEKKQEEKEEENPASEEQTPPGTEKANVTKETAPSEPGAEQASKTALGGEGEAAELSTEGAEAATTGVGAAAGAEGVAATEAAAGAVTGAEGVAVAVEATAETEAAVAGAAATSEIWVPVLIIVVVIILIILAIIAISTAMGQSGVTGSTPHQQSAADIQLQAEANAGDIIAKRQLDAQDIPKVLSLVSQIKQQALTKNDQPSAALCDQITSMLNSYSSNNSKADSNILQQVKNDLITLSNNGYGLAMTDYSVYLLQSELTGMIDNGQLIVDHANDKSGLETGVIKRSDGAEIKYNPGLAVILTELAKTYSTIEVSSIVGNHSKLVEGTNHDSAHWTGDAMDISALNGKSISQNQDMGCQLLQWFLNNYQALKKEGVTVNQTIGPVKCRGLQMQQDIPISQSNNKLTGYGIGHEDHVHIGLVHAWSQ